MLKKKLEVHIYMEMMQPAHRLPSRRMMRCRSYMKVWTPRHRLQQLAHIITCIVNASMRIVNGWEDIMWKKP